MIRHPAIRRASRLAPALTLALATAGCGDPVVILGDQPAIFRIVAGVPDTPGATVDSLGTASLLISPQGLAAAADGTVYIAVRRGRIVSVDARGRFDVLVDHDLCSAPSCVLGRPSGITLDGRGGLIVADVLNHRIWRLDLATRELSPVAGTGALGFSPDGTPALEAQLGTPTGVAVASDGRIIFSDRSNHRIRFIAPDGSLATLAGTGSAGFAGDGGPASAARFTGPAGLALAEPLLYIADTGNNRARVVDLSADIVRTVAGSGIAAFGGDGGPAVVAQLTNPIDVAISNDGRTLYIADAGNHRIRAVALLLGTISTFAGTGETGFNGDLLEAGRTALATPAALAVSPLNLLFLADSEHHIVRRTPLGF